MRLERVRDVLDVRVVCTELVQNMYCAESGWLDEESHKGIRPTIVGRNVDWPSRIDFKITNMSFLFERLEHTTDELGEVSADLLLKPLSRHVLLHLQDLGVVPT